MVNLRLPWFNYSNHVFWVLFVVKPWLIFNVVVYFNKSRSKTNYGLDFYFWVFQEAIISPQSLTYVIEARKIPLKGKSEVQWGEMTPLGTML